MTIPEFLRKFRRSTRPDEPALDSDAGFPPWPADLRRWWEDSSPKPTQAEMVAFIEWAHTAARAIAQMDEGEIQRAAVEEFERICSTFDGLPPEEKITALRLASNQSTSAPAVTVQKGRQVGLDL